MRSSDGERVTCVACRWWASGGIVVSKWCEREKILEWMASSFGGGMGRMRQTCGAVSGAAMVLGIVKGYDNPADNEAKKQHYALVREFAEKFKEKNKSINCGELLKMASLNAQAGGQPEQRSEEYYQKRPCPELVYDAGLILDEMLS